MLIEQPALKLRDLFFGEVLPRRRSFGADMVDAMLPLDTHSKSPFLPPSNSTA